MKGQSTADLMRINLKVAPGLPMRDVILHVALTPARRCFDEALNIPMLATIEADKQARGYAAENTLVVCYLYRGKADLCGSSAERVTASVRLPSRSVSSNGVAVWRNAGMC